MIDEMKLAEKRLDKLGFDEEEEGIIFSQTNMNIEFYEWLLSATDKEINTWFDLLRKVRR